MLTRTSWIASIFAGVLALGCVDPAGDYEDFKERQKKTTPVQGSGCGDPTATCDPPVAAELSGQWLFALSAQLSPTKPILFFADIVATDAAGGIEWTWTITPLSTADRSPLAALPALPPSTVPADGAWVVDLPELNVPGAANPITGSDITADTALTGNVCGSRDFLCGDVTGNVSKPITLDLAGSTWALTRLTTPDTLPSTVYYSCACGVAELACAADTDCPPDNTCDTTAGTCVPPAAP